MKYLNIFLVCLSVCGLAFSKECNLESKDEFSMKQIVEIASELDIDECEAADVHDFINRGYGIFEDVFQFSVDNRAGVKECEDLCEDAKKVFYTFYNDPENENNIMRLSALGNKMDGQKLFNECKSQCSVLPEYLENPENEESQNNISKRDTTCLPISSSMIACTESNYKFNIPRYQQMDNSVPTAIEEVNGCGPKILGGINLGAIYTGLFLPACNSHDVCYECQRGKDYCDTRFLINMYTMCNKKYDMLEESKKNESCKSKADIFKAAVVTFGDSSYERCGEEYNSSLGCAFCGNAIVRDRLATYSFYRKQ